MLSYSFCPVREKQISGDNEKAAEMCSKGMFANASFKMKHMEQHIVESFKNESYIPLDFCAVVKICFFPLKAKRQVVKTVCTGRYLLNQTNFLS